MGEGKDQRRQKLGEKGKKNIDREKRTNIWIKEIPEGKTVKREQNKY